MVGLFKDLGYVLFKDFYWAENEDHIVDLPEEVEVVDIVDDEPCPITDTVEQSTPQETPKRRSKMAIHKKPTPKKLYVKKANKENEINQSCNETQNPASPNPSPTTQPMSHSEIPNINRNTTQQQSEAEVPPPNNSQQEGVWPQENPIAPFGQVHLELGMEFATMDEFKSSVRKYNIQIGRSIKFSIFKDEPPQPLAQARATVVVLGSSGGSGRPQCQPNGDETRSRGRTGKPSSFSGGLVRCGSSRVRQRQRWLRTVTMSSLFPMNSTASLSSRWQRARSNGWTATDLTGMGPSMATDATELAAAECNDSTSSSRYRWLAAPSPLEQVYLTAAVVHRPPLCISVKGMFQDSGSDSRQ
ncbi:uncharacterized protein DS421_5g151610 [Arachis hypogaea]|nr:uncharacterized protein DS421_5g151610 [Arachis hypogaea]